jgi:glycosyltransferase involved in cell wall biosynthesis
MKVAIDARELCGKPTGVGRYLQELLTEWSTDPDAARHEWQLFAPAQPTVPHAFAGRVRVTGGSAGTWWEQRTLPRLLAENRPDVLFAPGYSAPLTAPCPTVVAIHDVSFAAHPEWFSAREGLRRRVIGRWSARRARRVITISEFSKGELVAHLGTPPGRIRVTPLAVRRPDLPAGTREPMVLYVGSIFERRHVDVLVDSFVNHVAGAVPGARLEIVGDVRLPDGVRVDAALDAASDSVKARARFRSYVDDDTLRALYGRASVFVFLSEYEGFGLTPLEAMAHGVPPVVLDPPVAREVYGPAAAYHRLGPSLPPELGRTLVSLLTEPEAHARLVNQAPAVLARYDWGRTAAATLRILEEAAGAR